MQRAMLCSSAIVTVGLAASISFASTFTRPPIRAAKSAASLLGRSTSKRLPGDDRLRQGGAFVSPKPRPSPVDGSVNRAVGPRSALAAQTNWR